MAYIYAADVWCDDCGRAIRDRLDTEGKRPADPDDEYTYDSDDYPKLGGDDDGGESDSPQHCGAGAECLAVETLPDGSRVGAFFRNPLTDEGERYVRGAVAEAIQRGDAPAGSVARTLWAPEYVTIVCDNCDRPLCVDDVARGDTLCVPCDDEASRYRIGGARVDVVATGRMQGHKPEYRGAIVCDGGTRWDFADLFLGPGTADDARPDAMRAAGSAVGFGGYYTADERGDDTPDWAPTPETADAISDATATEQDDGGDYAAQPLACADCGKLLTDAPRVTHDDPGPLGPWGFLRAELCDDCNAKGGDDGEA